jgi:hypothetical protein
MPPTAVLCLCALALASESMLAVGLVCSSVLLQLYCTAHVLAFAAWTLLGVALAVNAVLAPVGADVEQQLLLAAFFDLCLVWVGSSTHFCVLWLAV